MQLAKPPYGDPCNRCGFCCRVIICPLAEQVLGMPAEVVPLCLFLGDCDDGTTFCGLMSEPHRWAPSLSQEQSDVMGGAAMVLLGAGTNCDSIHDEDVSEHRVKAVRANAAAKYPPQDCRRRRARLENGNFLR